MTSLTVKDIKNKLKGYRYADATARDVHALITNFKSLKPQDPKQYIHINGAVENLMSLTGTIPVKVRGASYNIPVTIWMRVNHPYQCPMVRVTPTADMGIQPSKFVDNSGTVYLPYLTEWKHGSSDLTILTQIMCATFGDHCPVYSKRVPPSSQPVAWQPPRPVQPPSTYSYTNPGYPQRPPYPGSYPGPPTPYQPPGQPTPYPGGHAGMPTPYGSVYQPPGSAGSQPPYPMGQPPSSQYPGMYHPQPPAPPTSSIAAGAALGAGAAAISAAEERRQFEESERIKRQSLETAVEDKIRRQVKQVLDAAENEMSMLQNTQKELQAGSVKINQMMDDMEQKQRELDESVDMLRTKNVELESVLEYIKAQPDKVDVDEAIVATHPLYDQILRLYAEENAIDDTIYYLGEALRKGVIELEVFLKHVRELSRKQFMARATIMKARATAQLPPYGVIA